MLLGNRTRRVRPHLLEITRQPGGANHFRATTTHINSAGPVVKVEAVTEWGARIHVELSQEKFHSLQLVKNEVLFVTPKDIAFFEASANGKQSQASR